MTGRIIAQPERAHLCAPPTRSRFTNGNPVGTTWKCDTCHAVWQVRSDVRPPGYVDRTGWVQLGRLATWWWHRKASKART